MDWKTRVRSALPAIADDDVVEELAQHARAEYETARADGCTPEQADDRIAQLLAGWNVDAAGLRRRRRRPQMIEPPPPSRPSSILAGTARDFRYAARLLRRQPRFALLAVLTTALGIGTTTLLFSIVYGVLMEPLPWPAADRLVVIKETRGGNRPRFGSISNAAYLAWTEQPATLEAIAAWSMKTVTLTGVGDAERLRVVSASAGVFQVLGVRPLIGSVYEAKDEGSPVVVLSESFWRQRFGADRTIIGRAVHFDNEPLIVLGVVPDAQSFPDRQTRAWVPFRVQPAAGNLLSMFEAIARLRPGVGPVQASSEGTARGRFAADTGLTTMAIFGSKGQPEISVQPLRESLTGDVQRPLLVLLAAVALLLVTATANVASLQLARTTTRQREIAVRAALGAGNLRITRQLVAESLLVGLAGGAVGLLLTWMLQGVLPTVLPADFPRIDHLRVNTIVVLFALTLAVLTGVIFGLIPARRVRHLDLVQLLAEDATAPVGTGGRSTTGRVRMAIMAAQVAIACVLLIGAGLLGRSFVTLLTTDRGYDPSGVLTARIALPSATYKADRKHAILRQILDRLSTTPGVRHAAFTSELPLGPGGSTNAFVIRSVSAEAGSINVQASPRIVSAGYFAAMRMRVVEGRGFSEEDSESAPPVVVVNRAFARKFLKDRAVGTKVPMAAGYEQPSREATIVGVVDDIRYLTAGDSTLPEVYYCYRQFAGKLPVSTVTLIVRAAEDPAALARPVRTAVREADDRLVAESVLTMNERMLRGLARPRLYAIVLGGFATSALLVAAVGLFGVLSYTVAQRSRELAVRTALGARRTDVVKLVFGQTIAVAGVGIAIGVLVSFALMRSVAALLHGVTPHDAVTFVAAPVLLLLVAAAAALPPSLRAARMDPRQLLTSNY